MRSKIATLGLILALGLASLPAHGARAATITVTTSNDTLDAAAGCATVSVALLPGPDDLVSLREAICAANNNTGPDTIAFNIPGGGVHTIQPTMGLPSLTGGGTAIIGYSQPGAAPAVGETPATILIEIDGTNTTNQSGLYIGSANNVVQGLAINRFDLDGIDIALETATGNVITGTHLGTNPGGTIDRGNGHSGVYIGLGATNNIVGGDEPAERNVLSGNEWSGAEIHGSSTMSNTILGNYIGTTADGMAALSNTLGVRIYGGAQNNIIGGAQNNIIGGEHNLISGNAVDGVRISGAGTTSNTVSGNLIGVDASGISALGNGESGVHIGGAENSTIHLNIIAGNAGDGVHITGEGTNGNLVSDNCIGGHFVGPVDLGNTGNGVYIGEGAQGNIISGTDYSSVIAFNAYGVVIAGDGTDGNTVSASVIYASDLDGVYIHSGAQNNTIGPDNIIIYGAANGVWVEGSATTGNIITQNGIGLNSNAGIDLENGANGGILAPVIVTHTAVVGSLTIRGIACPGCTVEVLANDDTDGEGQSYLGSAVADGSGNFDFTESDPHHPYLTATATDAISGTSEFSAVYTATIIHAVYLPLVLKEYTIYFEGPWEVEPNDDAKTQANGPIRSAQTYYGTFLNQADEKDYFYLYLSTARTVELWLTNIPVGGDYDLVLRDANLNLVKLSDNKGQADEHILSDVLPVGRYHVQVYNYSKTGSTQPYHLRVVYQ